MTKKAEPHPMQPLVVDDRGVIRFRANEIVRALLDAAREGRRMDPNMIATMGFSPEDEMQLAQLIGYSVGGYGELHYVTDASYEAAEKLAKPLRALLGKKKR